MCIRDSSRTVQYRGAQRELSAQAEGREARRNDPEELISCFRAAPRPGTSLEVLHRPPGPAERQYRTEHTTLRHGGELGATTSADRIAGVAAVAVSEELPFFLWDYSN